MNYIITGGTGFIGTHLTNLIKAEHPDAEVWNLDIVEPKEERKSRFVCCDVRKPIADLPFTPTADDILFNFAAVHRTPGHPDRAYFETNIRGAENVCAFAGKWDIRRMVFTSSIAPYGASEELKEETTLPTPNTPYGISKLVAEKIHLAWKAGRKKRQLTIVRPGVVFGKGENGNFTRLYWAIRGHKFAYPGRKDTIKACIYVKELVRFMLWRSNLSPVPSLAPPLSGEGNPAERGADSSTYIYNCCYEPAYTIEQIVQAMKRVTGMKAFVPDIPNWLIMPAATMIGALGAPMGICPARVKKLQISTNICGKKLVLSGYPFHWTFEEALADWFKDNDGAGLR